MYDHFFFFEVLNCQSCFTMLNTLLSYHKCLFFILSPDIRYLMLVKLTILLIIFLTTLPIA